MQAITDERRDELLGRDRLSTTEAAELTGYDPASIRRFARSGRVPALKIGNMHTFRPNDLAPLMTDPEPGQAGRPKGSTTRRH